MASFRTATFLGTKPLILPDAGPAESIAIDINWPDAGAGIAVNDVVTLCELPPGFQVVDWCLITDDIDSNGTPTVAFSIGELNGAGTALAVTYQASIASAQTGGTTRATGFLHVTSPYNTTRRLALLATAATATAALANKRAVFMANIRSVS